MRNESNADKIYAKQINIQTSAKLIYNAVNTDASAI